MGCGVQLAASAALNDGIMAVPFIDIRVGRRAFHTIDVMVITTAQEICDQSACRNRFFEKFGKHTQPPAKRVVDAYLCLCFGVVGLREWTMPFNLRLRVVRRTTLPSKAFTVY